MEKEIVKEVTSTLGVCDCNAYYLFRDGVLSMEQFKEFILLVLDEYHHGLHELTYHAGNWELWCYHRYIGIRNIISNTEKVIETLDAPFYYNSSNYKVLANLHNDINCFIELFETAYCRLKGYKYI
ncbi:MAG: hypothetical protein KBT06_10730 [Prevotellaceae bacterium]|nr:hypothetical protein [Candidatus Colivivens equi]